MADNVTVDQTGMQPVEKQWLINLKRYEQKLAASRALNVAPSQQSLANRDRNIYGSAVS